MLIVDKMAVLVVIANQIVAISVEKVVTEATIFKYTVLQRLLSNT